jgi:hypothetical protein
MAVVSVGPELSNLKWKRNSDLSFSLWRKGLQVCELNFNKRLNK